MPDKLATSIAALGIALAPAFLKFADSKDTSADTDTAAEVQCISQDAAPVHGKYQGTGTDARLASGAVVQIISARKNWRHVAYVDDDVAALGWITTQYLADCVSDATPPATTRPQPHPPAPTGSSRSTGELPASCGKERWSIKTGTDNLAPNVDLTALLPTTIRQMDAFAWPLASVSVKANLPDERFTPVETQVYTLKNVSLVCFKHEADHDYHLVLEDGADTMVGEIPDPACTDSASPFAAGIAQARAAFESQFPDAPTKCPTDLSSSSLGVISVSGVGFFDRIHGQTGVSPTNGIELHPILSICFGKNCSLP